MDFKNKIMLAPMVSVNNIAFRKLCSDYGADIVYSQMIDSVGFIRGSRRLVDFFDEKNLIAQFLGNDPKSIVESAKAVSSKVIGVDLNLGCPHSNVVGRKCGSYLMKYPKKIAAVVRGLVKNVDVNVSVKIRAGYDKEHINAVSIAKLCEKEGIFAIAIHGRARTVNYMTPVDYSIIKKVKDAVNVPVIGNGDIFDGKSAKKMFSSTGCDSVMVGRGAMGNPGIFDEIKAFLAGKKGKTIDKKKMFLRYLKYCKKYDMSFVDIKKQAQWFTKGIVGGGEYRLKMNDAKSVDELKEIYSLI